MIGAPNADRSSSLRFARVTFTGRPVSMTWREAGEVVRAAGGDVTTSVSRRTSMLVVGMDGWPVLRDGTVSRKLVRAEELNERGATIEIVSEAVFLERAGRAPAAATGNKTYSLEQVCDVLELAPRALKRWEALGLVRSYDGQYDFQDLVSLREIAELIGRGVAPGTLARSVRGLARVLPDAERPLAQLKVVEGAGELLAELGDALLAPDGQLVLRFDGPVPEAVAGSLSAPARAEMRTACDWFDEAQAREDEERFDEAMAAYRKTLALQPRFPEAHFNLGNVLRAVGRPEAAEEQLIMAVNQEPAMASAWYNLADVQEELGRLDDAIASLNAALLAHPAFADGHYNLALCYEDAGRTDDARRHWHAYLKLDPGSPWASRARAHLARLT